MALHRSSSRFRYGPSSLVRSVLLVLSFAFSTLADPIIALNTPAQGSVTSCASLLATWVVLQTTTSNSVDTAINNTWIGIWATNVNVDQTTIQTTPTNPGPSRQRAKRLLARQQVVPAPVTINITTQPVPLISGGIPFGGAYTWTPVTLPPNQYYVMYLRSLPGHSKGLDIAVQSQKFFVSAGASETCLDGIIQSMTVTSSTSTSAETSSVPSPTSNPNDAAPTTVTSSKKNHTGAIVGGVIGGVVLLGLILYFVFCFRKRRKSANSQDLGDFLATRGVNPYGRRPLTSIERRTSSYDPTRYSGILAAIGIHSPEKENPRQSRASGGGFYPRRSSYYRQADDNFDGTTFADPKRTSVSKFRQSDVDMATVLAATPTAEALASKSGTRKSKSSSITTFAQSVANVPYHPYNSTSASHEGDDGGLNRRESQRHTRHSSQLQRTSEGYRMSSGNHPSAAQDDIEPEVMVWTGPSQNSHNRTSTAMSGVERRSSTAMSGVEPRSSTAMSGGELKPSDGGELGALAIDEEAPLARKKSTGTSNRTPSTKASVTRKKAPELPLPGDEPTDSAPVPPPSAYFAGTHGQSQSTSTTTVNTGASAYVPSQATRDRRSADLMTYQNGRRSSEVFAAPGTSAPGQAGAFDAFAGAKDGPVHLLMPDLPPEQEKQ
ncbi:hypothetical protein FRC04_010324 [Tulasnella sp. 424]|nr:hypothetical protein FRC04_010324 [Tulasnella sp. 424]KAG8978734.1 hypothetical protein FRC05_010008 [Tulasnella sp. 425]